MMEQSNQATQAMHNDLATLHTLIHTALYDRSGESVEGAFADHWISNASRAIEQMNTLFEDHGFTAAYAAKLQEAIQSPDVPQETAIVLFAQLERWAHTLVKELLQNPLPHIRAIAVKASAETPTNSAWLQAFDDPSPLVRLAAQQALNTHRRSSPEADHFLMHALKDDQASVRQAAAGLIRFYRKADVAAALVHHLEHESNPQVRKAILRNMASTLQREGLQVQGAALEEAIGAGVLAALTQERDSDELDIRQMVAAALERLEYPKQDR